MPVPSLMICITCCVSMSSSVITNPCELAIVVATNFEFQCHMSPTRFNYRYV